MLKLEFSLKEVFRDGFPKKGKASEKLNLICVLDNLKLILLYSNKDFRSKNILRMVRFSINIYIYA